MSKKVVFLLDMMEQVKLSKNHTMETRELATALMALDVYLNAQMN